ncbi:MAG TPA: hypothetical protein DEG44_02055 [Candidatus Kerfeldbacteria bacterium]|nr:hypothetical protein [Candidatus Kerfeldbacteria bacterium]
MNGAGSGIIRRVCGIGNVCVPKRIMAITVCVQLNSIPPTHQSGKRLSTVMSAIKKKCIDMTTQCKQCHKTFQIEPDDQAYYDKIKVPAPTQCPDCRMQRRLAWRNERFYYQRTCGKTGKQIISIYAPDSPIRQVYQHEAWFQDDWDALDYGRDFDFSKPFFPQFAELMWQVPHVNLWTWEGENADYNHCCFQLKNSYMNSSTDKSEDSYYSYISLNNRSVADCTAVEDSELAIECVDSDHLYQCAYCQQCRNCLETYLSFDCVDCKYTFGCVGLRHKEYYIFNKPVSQTEWEQQIPGLLASYQKLQAGLKRMHDLGLSVPHLYNAIYNSDNCTGNYIWNSHNCQLSFDIRQGENLKYCWYSPWDGKDNMDCYANGEGQLLYDANFGAPAYNTQFTFWLKNISDSQYCILCVNGCKDLFGCVGLKKKQYCILNKQYTESEYVRLRDKIVAHMKTTGEYGELFPVEYSPFGYNETTAQEYFPLNQADVRRNGWKWRDNTGGTFGKETITEIADNIAEITEQITKEILACSDCRKNFQIIPQEFKMYQQLDIALPRLCPNCRHLRRIKLRNPRRLWKRQCMCTQPDHHHDARCANQFETSYSPDTKELIYCERCYQKEII